MYFIFAMIKLYYIAKPSLLISILELDINKTNISLLIKITLHNCVKALCFRVRPVLTLIFLVVSCINVMSESKRNRSTVVPYSHAAGLYSKKKNNPIFLRGEMGEVNSEKKTSVAFYLSFG